MEKKTKQANLQRRSFLLTLGAGTAGAAAVVVGTAGKAPQVLQAAEKAEAGQGQGYAESAHVRNYYRTTRI